MSGTISHGGGSIIDRAGGASSGDLLNITSVVFGDGATDGNWRIIPSGVNLSVQRRESGVWVEKASFNP